MTSFVANGPTFNFETDFLKGTLQPEGAYHGITRLTDLRTGRQFIDERYSALNLFKLFSTNLCMGQPRRMERRVRLDSQGGVEIHWPADESFLGEVFALYTVSGASSIDLKVTVRTRTAYRAFELFLSSYFDQAMVPNVYLKSPVYGKSSGGPERVIPTVNDSFRGTVIVFPRDTHSARHCVDGRWDRSESANETVQMCPVRHFSFPLAYVADLQRNLAVVIMATSDCYALSTRYHAEKDEDRLVSYSAFDCSLFGQDCLPDDQFSVRIRMAVTPLDEAHSQPLALYQSFANNE